MPSSIHTLAAHSPQRGQVIRLEAHRPVLMIRDPGDDPAGLQTAQMVYRPERRKADRMPEAPPTVESIQEGQRLMGCNGNCVQGRQCDCGPSEAPHIPRITDQRIGEHIGNVIGYGVLGLLVFLLAIAVMARPGFWVWVRGLVA
jgi:hypothetical protein